jgi:hypothetical protein
MKYLINDNTNFDLHGLIIEIPDDYEREFFQVGDTFLRVSHMIKNPTAEDVSRIMRDLLDAMIENRGWVNE